MLLRASALALLVAGVASYRVGGRTAVRPARTSCVRCEAPAQQVAVDVAIEYGGIPSVRVLVGEEDTIHDFPTQLAHCSAHGFEAVGPIAGAGGFILFQRPGLVLDHLRQLSPVGGA